MHEHFDSYLCQATWINAHLLDIILIWFVKTDKKPPDLDKTASCDEKHLVPFCEQNLEATDGKGYRAFPLYISRPKPILYEINHKLSNR